MKADPRVDHVGEIAHGGRLENEIFLLHEHLAGAPQVFFMHGERHCSAYI